MFIICQLSRIEIGVNAEFVSLTQFSYQVFVCLFRTTGTTSTTTTDSKLSCKFFLGNGVKFYVNVEWVRFEEAFTGARRSGGETDLLSNSPCSPRKSDAASEVSFSSYAQSGALFLTYHSHIIRLIF